ncbi:Thymocyte nuclear protein 1, partial [Pseudolycoriella hygida]
MSKWILKSEPETWSWDSQVADKVTAWDGVRNYQAAANLKNMKNGDLAFFYHSGKERRVMGIVRVIRESYPDKTDPKGKFVCVDVETVESLENPVTLAQIKSQPELKDLALVRQSRLSVMWASFQAWIKKWNKIMAVIFSALGIILLLSTVIVNALDVHEDNQEQLKPKNGNSTQILITNCQCKRKNSCLLHCGAGNSTDISKELNYHWETNTYCQSTMSVEISSTVRFPDLTITANWLDGSFKLTELQIDLENIFVVSENAFAGDVFKSMQKLILNNFHLQAMDMKILKNLLVEHNYQHLTVAKNSKGIFATVEVQMDSTIYSEIEGRYHVHYHNSYESAIQSDGGVSHALIISLTIVGCILSFSLGLLIRHNLYKQKRFFNKINKVNLINKNFVCFFSGLFLSIQIIVLIIKALETDIHLNECKTKFLL